MASSSSTMTNSHPNYSSAQWNRLASHARNLSAITQSQDPRVPPIAAMIKSANALHPFATATAILESGCGAAPVLSTLLSSPTTTSSTDIDLPTPVASICDLIASDSSPAMLSQVSSIQAEHTATLSSSPWSRVTTRLDDAQTLSTFPSNTLSHALSSFCFFLVPDPAAAVRAHHRALAPGGVLASSSLNPTSEWMAACNAALATVAPHLPPAMRGTSHESVASVKRDFENAGFGDVEAYEVPVQMGFETRAQWARFATEVLPNMVDALAPLSEQERARVREEVEKEMEKVTSEEPGVMKGVAVVGVGRK